MFGSNNLVFITDAKQKGAVLDAFLNTRKEEYSEWLHSHVLQTSLKVEGYGTLNFILFPVEGMVSEEVFVILYGNENRAELLRIYAVK